MRIDAIVPYERNARYNDKAVPAVAESIREFGFKGAVVLNRESEGGTPEHPVIVNGHTRIKALKSLGWEELPDEYIVYTDGLTEEEVKALRLADNKTAEIATWNKALLKSEVKLLDKSNIDMSRFNFDFKSRQDGFTYGQERLKTDNSYNLGIVSAADCDDSGMPYIRRCESAPNRLIPFNYAMSSDDKDAWLHFFIDDYQFERLWNQPEKYLELIKSFNGVLSPDFSLYMDMALPMQRWNEYRRRALQNYWQRNGVDVIPTLSWTDERSYGFCFDGIPHGSTVAVSTVGVAQSSVASEIWFGGMKAAMESIEPERVILYGSNIGFDFGGAEVVSFKANTAFSR